MNLDEAAEKPPLLTDDELSAILQHPWLRNGYVHFVDRFMDKTKLPALCYLFSHFGLHACIRYTYEKPWYSSVRVCLAALRIFMALMGYRGLSRLQATAGIVLVMYYRYFMEYRSLPRVHVPCVAEHEGSHGH